MGDRIRLDKWLWQARFFKSRSLSVAVVEAGHVRLNGQHVTKPAHPVGQGDVLIFAQGSQIRVIRILGCGTRRGPAAEAAGLYEDLSAGSTAAGQEASQQSQEGD